MTPTRSVTVRSCVFFRGGGQSALDETDCQWGGISDAGHDRMAVWRRSRRRRRRCTVDILQCAKPL